MNRHLAISAVLALSSSTFAQAPPNDLCANAIAMTCNSMVSGTTVGSTTTGAPGNCITTLNTIGGVWYVVPGWNGDMIASLCGSSYNTKIGVFSGSCGSLQCIKGNDNDTGPGGAGVCGGGLVSSTTWTASAGTNYYIYVTGSGTSTGTFNLTMSCGDNNFPCPANGLVLELQTDANGSQTSYELIPQGLGIPVCSGSGLPNNATITNNCCLPNGCYRLRVLDSAGDGMTSGGYSLRTSGGERIIDNMGNFSSGSVSAIAGDQGFCVPIGSNRLIYTSCDKLDWVDNEFLVASLDPAVSAEWINNAPNSQQDADSGYEFWFFDPNGGYSFRWFRPHNTSHGYGSGAARAAHLRINNWLAAYHIPANTLMNVRVRSRVNGVNGEWGPACRFKIDPVAAACPMTKLMDIPGNQFLSCGEYRPFESGSYVHARPVNGATQYQFRFRQPGEGFEVIRSNPSYFVQLWWLAPVPQLITGSQYEVDVRAFKNGQWCPWGEVCMLNIGTAPGAAPGNDQNLMPGHEAMEFNVWPNPNNGDQVTISLHGIAQDVRKLDIELLDLNGRKVLSRQFTAPDSDLTTTIDLNGSIADGIYLVRISAGTTIRSQRLVISR